MNEYGSAAQLDKERPILDVGQDLLEAGSLPVVVSVGDEQRSVPASQGLGRKGGDQVAGVNQRFDVPAGELLDSAVNHGETIVCV